MRLIDHSGLKDKGIRFSRVHVRRLEDKGRFPKHVDLGENRIAWVESEVDDWLEAKLAARNDPSTKRAPRGKHRRTTSAEL